MSIFNDGMYTKEEVEKIKEIYLDVGWLLRDFESTPYYLQKKWSHEYIKKNCFEKYEFEIIAKIMTEHLQQHGYDYEVKYKDGEIFDELYLVEAAD